MDTEKFNKQKINLVEKSLMRLRLFIKDDFYKSNIILWLLVLNLFFNLANWIMLAFFMRSVDGEIILHYNVYFGVDSIGDWKQVFIMPTIGIALFAINWALARYFYGRKERIASYALLLASLLSQLSLIIASISVILINY
jgi:hypothetical protein